MNFSDYLSIENYKALEYYYNWPEKVIRPEDTGDMLLKGFYEPLLKFIKDYNKKIGFKAID